MIRQLCMQLGRMIRLHWRRKSKSGVPEVTSINAGSRQPHLAQDVDGTDVRQASCADDIPLEIVGSEPILRALCLPYHYDAKKKKLKRGAFRHPSGRLSVFRLKFLGADCCKQKGALLGSVDDSKKYIGFYSSNAEALRNVGCEVEDARADFPGHAHIMLSFYREIFGTEPLPKGVPLPPDKALELDGRIDKLIGCGQVIHDPEPDADLWTGPNLLAM